MQVIRNERVVYFDVDDTLVIHREIFVYDHHDKTVVSVVDPIDINNIIHLGINQPMVRLLKEEYARRSYVIVWSRGGFAWAKAVVEALGLEQYVHTVQTKPAVYFDDKPIQEWLLDRVYMKPGTYYKGKK
jgi:hypothetical protein